MENKQTAVEWMFDKLLEEGPSGELRWHLKYDIFKIFEQAKTMEREQLIDAIQFGYLEEADFQGIDYFYETRFNGGKNICPDCKQGILRLDRPGKMGCSVC